MTWYNRRGTKYGAKSTEYNGSVFHSKKEAGRAAELDLLERANEIENIRRQVRISFDICASCLRLCSSKCSKHPKEIPSHITNYYIDFVYRDKKTGEEIYEEVKGFETGEWKLKWKLLCLLYERDPKKKLIVTR
jgi:hypothetical protein